MRIAETISKILVDNGVIQQSEKEVYRYGIELFILKGCALVLAIIISIGLNATNILFLFLLLFVPIRRYSGGIHASSPITCLIISEMLLILCYWIIKNVPISPGIGGLVLIVSEIVILLFSPDASEKKPISNNQKHKYKRYVAILCGAALVIFVLMELNRNILISKMIVVVYSLQALLLISSKYVRLK